MIQKAHKRPKVEVNSYKGKRFTGLMKAVFVLVLTGAAVFALLLGQVLGGARDDINGDPKVMVILGCQLYDWGQIGRASCRERV